jgi:hypothetical protein
LTTKCLMYSVPGTQFRQSRRSGQSMPSLRMSSTHPHVRMSII